MGLLHCMCRDKCLKADECKFRTLLAMLRGEGEWLYWVQEGVDEADLVKVLAPKDVCCQHRICDANHLRAVMMLTVSS